MAMQQEALEMQRLQFEKTLEEHTRELRPTPQPVPMPGRESGSEKFSSSELEALETCPAAIATQQQWFGQLLGLQAPQVSEQWTTGDLDPPWTWVKI